MFLFEPKAAATSMSYEFLGGKAADYGAIEQVASLKIVTIFRFFCLRTCETDGKAQCWRWRKVSSKNWRSY